MAENWPWETSSRAPPTSSTQTSSLQSGSSLSSHEVSAVAELDRPTTLVETLRTCLANAAPTEPAAAAAAAGRSGSLQQPLRGPGSRTSMKRRSRASRRVPTTVVEATRSDFRETVHRLTGIPTPTPVSAPVRPQPQRPFFRPPSQPTPWVPPSPRPQLLNPLLHITEAPPPMYPAFWNSQPQHLDPTFVKSESAEGFESGIGGLSQSALASTMSQLMSVPSESIQTWWDAVPQTQSQSQSLSMNPTTTRGPFDSSGTPGAGPISQDDFDDWFRQDHSGSDYMR